LSVYSQQHYTQAEPSITRSKRSGESRLGFALFIGVNALLLIRPQELFPKIEYLHPYLVMILACLVIYGPRMLDELRWKQLMARPITLCVLALVPVMSLSMLWNSKTEGFAEYTLEFAKMMAYYLLLLCAVDTPAKIRRFCVLFALIIALVGLLPVLDYHKVISIETLKQLSDIRVDARTGENEYVARLIGVGIFNDPNDLAQILGVGLILGFYGMDIARRKTVKLLWLLPMGLMLYAIYLTQSRGGFLALVAGISVLFINRYGWKKAVVLGGCALPVLAAVFLAGTTLSTKEASAQTRVQLWSDALLALKGNPLLGLSPGGFNEVAGQVAHNSFLEAYAETGIVGGLLFATAYYVAIWGVLRLRNRKIRVLDPDLAKLTPILSAALVCYCVGMLSLTRNYVIPTYTMLALSAVYLWLVRTEPARRAPQWGMGLLGRTFALSVVYLLAMQVFVRLSVHWN
jgi:O-antigen ligase